MSVLGATIAEFPPVKIEILIQAIERETWLLKYICDQYKTQYIHERAVDGEECALKFVSEFAQENLRTKCVAKSWRKIFITWNKLPRSTKHNKCVKRP